MKPRTVLAGIAAMLDAAALSWIVATFFAIAATSAFAGRVPFLPETAPTNDTPVAVRVLGNNMPIVRGEVDGKPCHFRTRSSQNPR